MRRMLLAALCGVVPALTLSLVLVGCNSSAPTEGPKAEENTKKEKEKDDGKKAEAKPVKMGNGTIKGKVILVGDKPNTEELTKTLLAEIDKKKDDKDHCLKGSPSEVTEQQWRIGKDNAVGNVFVWLIPAKDTFFEFDEDPVKKLNMPAEVVIDQPHCAFVPHAAIVMPQYRDSKNKLQPSGQKLVVKNSAPISHNTKWEGDTSFGKGNETIPGEGKGKPIVFDPKLSKTDVRLQCSIHPWMQGYVWTFDHPYAALTKVADKDDDATYGTYEIKNVPTGVKMRIIAWHEVAGYLTKDGKAANAEDIEVKDGETVEKNFEAKAK